jgi:Flp pilus assembly protein TadD
MKFYRGCKELAAENLVVPLNRTPMRLVLLILTLTSAVMSAFTMLAQESSSPQLAQVEGIVRDGAGKPLSGVSVIFQKAGGKSASRTESKVDGTFTASALPAGSYTVTLEKSGITDVVVDSLILAPAEKKHFEFAFTRLQSVASSGSTSSLTKIDLDDRPNFTVAGVTDSTGSGGHGSQTKMQTDETLARDTADLATSTGKGSAAPIADHKEIVAARERAGRALAQGANLGKPEQASLHRVLADLDEKLNDPLSAVREYQRAAELDPNEQNYFSWAAELLLHRAEVPAVEIFRKGARLHSDSARMLAGLGAALYVSGSTEEAAEQLCQAADLAPSQPEPYFFLGKIQEATWTPLPCAVEKLLRFAHDQTGNALASYYAGLALWKQARVSTDADALRQAEALLQKSTEIDPNLAPAFLELGNLQLSRGQLPEAIANYSNAVAASPAGSQAHYRLGLAYRRSGQADRAQSEFDQYKKLKQAELAAAETERREVQQFLFVLQDKPDSTSKRIVAPSN